tara:strand:+ start:817 stop:1251 length:435 start_codon:yes stop_codon:yes gene_type:complete
MVLVSSENWNMEQRLTLAGQPSTKVYSDIADLQEITSFPIENHVHRDVDMALLEAQKRFSVPTAIVSPPMIHGVGQGPLKQRSIQVPFLIEAILKRGKGFQVLDGENIWDREQPCVAFLFILTIDQKLTSMTSLLPSFFSLKRP